MSRKPIIILFSVLTVGFIFAVSNYESEEYKKQMRKKHKHLRITAKVSLPIRAKIEADYGPYYAGDEFEVVGVASAHGMTDDLNIHWAIPDTLEVIEGLTHYTIRLEDIESSHRSVLRLKSLTDTNEQIHFTVKSGQSGVKFSKTDQFNTVLQEEVDREISSIKERHKEFVEDNF